MIFNWGVEQTNFGPLVFNWSVGDGGSAPIPPDVDVVQTPAGRRKRQRYIARHEGIDYDFSTLEDLEFFVREVEAKQDKRLPAKAKKKPKTIKLSFEPEYKEDIEKFAKVSDVLVPKIDLMPIHEAMARVRTFEERYQAWKLRLRQEDEELLMLYELL